MSRRLFLSHSGIDADAAAALKARILASPAARESGLAVWFDKDDLRAGEPWQRQLEDALARSHAFAVYVGSKGVVNWVEAEVHLALNRAITEPDFRFVPILAGAAPGPQSLPGFAQQFQAVVDVEARPDQFDQLMRAVLGGARAGTLQLETEPFFGLRAIDESRSHLFFGREEETAELTERVHRTPLVLVTGDSGSGKSSLVRAGLVPRFRGGMLALLDGARPANAIWHVVTTQPRNQPFRQLGDAVGEAAKGLGLTLADRGTLADWAAGGEIDKVRRALRCDLPPERVQILLVVDQFEELLTITPQELRAPFIDLLLALGDPADGRHKVVLTMRHDYANLSNAFEPLKARLDADDRRARFLLGRMSDEGLRRIVTEPLCLAAVEPGDREALAREILRDVGERPGDLALVQMALTETWHVRDQYGGDLLRAYAAVGRVEGALAQAAERVRTQLLGDQERELLDTILLRLVRLGDTGGATRRVASREQFDDTRWSLVQKLASEDGKRLVLLRGSAEQPTVEIAHEALVTAWPYFQNLLQQTAEDKRILDTLIPRAQAWAAEVDQGERNKRRATGADLELFAALGSRRSAWLSDNERLFVEASVSAEQARLRRQRWQFRVASAFAVVFLTVAIGAVWFYLEAQEQARVATTERNRANEQTELAERRQSEAEEQTRVARANESRAMAALSEIAFNQHRYIDAVKLALAAWPRTPDADRPRLRATIKALGQAQRLQRQTIPPLRHEGPLSGAAFNGTETRILTWSEDGTARLWDATTGEQAVAPLRHEDMVWGATFNGDGTRILTWSADGTARLWDAATGDEVLPPLRHEDMVWGAVFNGDETRILTWSLDGTARLWDAATGDEVLPPLRHEDVVLGATFNGEETRILTWYEDNPTLLWDAATGEELLSLHNAYGAVFNGDETRILTWSADGTARLWDAATGEELMSLHHGGVNSDVLGAAFNDDETRILTWSEDDTARLWDAATGEEVVPPLRHAGNVRGAAFNDDETRILTWSEDDTARLWDAATGEELMSLHHGGVNSDVLGAVFNGYETRILTWSADGAARLWDAATGDEVLPPLRHEDGVLGAVFNGDEAHILTWSADGTARLWDVATGDEVLPPLRHEDEVLGASFNGDETRILTWSEDGTARLWDAATGEEVLRLRHAYEVSGVVFNGDETRILTWSRDRTARLWDAATGEEVLRLHHAYEVLGASFNGDETRILTWSRDGTARLWDVATGEEILSLRHEGDVYSAVRGAVFNSDKTRILTWSRDGTARLWDAATGEELLSLRHEAVEGVRGAAFNRDETRILTWPRDDNTVRLWDVATGEELLSLRHEADDMWGADVRGAAFNGDETRILTWSEDNTARLWDATTGEEVVPPLRHAGNVRGAAFNAGETRILTWSEDGTARLWDAARGEEVVPPLRHAGNVRGAAFNDDETRILTWSEDDTARLWDAATGEEVVPPLRHRSDMLYVASYVLGAVFSGEETRILTWSEDDTVRLWDISRLPRGDLIDIACGMLPDHDTSELEDRYGIAVTVPICGPDTPAPVWAELVD